MRIESTTTDMSVRALSTRLTNDWQNEYTYFKYVDFFKQLSKMHLYYCAYLKAVLFLWYFCNSFISDLHFCKETSRLSRRLPTLQSHCTFITVVLTRFPSTLYIFLPPHMNNSFRSWLNMLFLQNRSLNVLRFIIYSLYHDVDWKRKSLAVRRYPLMLSTQFSLI